MSARHGLNSLWLFRMNVATRALWLPIFVVAGLIVAVVVASPHVLVIHDGRTIHDNVSVEVKTGISTRRNISCLVRGASYLCGFWGGTLTGAYFFGTTGVQHESHSCYFSWLMPSLHVVTLAPDAGVTCR